MKTLALLITLIAPTLSYALNLNCYAVGGKNPPLILSYAISNSESARLSSDVSLRGRLISSNQVAQYQATSNELFLLIDDEVSAQKTQYQFRASNPLIKKPFLGTLYSSVPKEPQKMALSCTLTN